MRTEQHDHHDDHERDARHIRTRQTVEPIDRVTLGDNVEIDLVAAPCPANNAAHDEVERYGPDDGIRA